MQAACDARGVELTPSRLRMARLPAGSELVENAISVAPGFMIGNVIVMAGVPDIMRTMLDAVTPRLKTGLRMLSESIPLDRPESQIAELFAAHQKRYPDVAMGSYPAMRDGRLATELVLRSIDAARLKDAIDTLKAALGI